MAQAKVEIHIWWASNGTVGKGVLGLGHGGMQVVTGTKTGNHYITWNGPNSENGCSGSARFNLSNNGVDFGFDRRFGQYVPRVSTRTLDMEVDTYNYRLKRKQETIAIQALPDPNESAWFGLDTNRILTWWENHLTDWSGSRFYKAVSTDKNCNAIVVKALLAGGAENFVPRGLGTKTYVYQGAATLSRWANQVRLAIEQANKDADKVKHQIRKVANQLDSDDRKVWSLATWKSKSNAGFFARRKEQVARIDELLPKYHQAVLGNDKNLQRDLLIQMMIQVCSHLATKLTSVRRNAVLMLGAQLVCARRALDGDE